MDLKAKEAQLDEAQWERAKARSLAYAEKCKTIERVIFCHTIEPNKLFVKLWYDDGREHVMEMTTTEACWTEFPKCDVLAETVFNRAAQ